MRLAQSSDSACTGQSNKGLEVDSNVRSKARLIAGAEKAKKVLSTVNDALIEVDNLLDIDVREPLKRATIEALWVPILERVQETVANAFVAANLTPQDCTALQVEIIGGGVRVPGV
jgi:heat shock 70kDa protein 4